MQEIFADKLQWIAELDPVFTIVGFFLTVLSIAYAIYSHRKSNIVAYPKIYYKNISEISKLSNENRKINVTYDYKVVHRVTLTRIRFWNAGKRPIRQEDIPKEEPLSIRLLDIDGPVQILDFSVLKTTPGVGNIELLLPDGSSDLLLDFEYLDSGAGIVIDIQHTGDKSDTWVELKGRILGPKKDTKFITEHTKPFKIDQWLYNKYGRRINESYNYILQVIVSAGLFIGLLLLVLGETKSESFYYSQYELAADSLLQVFEELPSDSTAAKETILNIINPNHTDDLQRVFLVKIAIALAF